MNISGVKYYSKMYHSGGDMEVAKEIIEIIATIPAEIIATITKIINGFIEELLEEI